ncbi:MAG: hypothetical protein AAGI15_13435 [Pseudomonadota bacterium]
MRAPGKLILWGEYAVLAGAPAAAIAVNCYATATFEAAPWTREWAIDTPGLQQSTVQRRLDRLLIESFPDSKDPTALLWHVLTSLGPSAAELPLGAHLTLDSRAFARDGRKLGLGSSAAVTVALSALLQQQLKQSPSFELALRAHRSLQGGKGSGMDVATAFCGGAGIVGLQGGQDGSAPAIETAPWPKDLHWRAYWTGSSASTPGHIGRFDTWRQHAPDLRALDALSAAAAALTERFEPRTFAAYSDTLWQFDQTAQLGIYSEAHAQLRALAAKSGVTYKPCGAGGGDCGIAISSDVEALSRFDARLANEAPPSTQPLDLRLATHGIAEPR